MADHSDCLTLRMEAAAELFVLRQLILQNLDGNQPVQPVASGFIYHSHTAGTDDFLNFVSVIQQTANIFILIHKKYSFRSRIKSKSKHW
jgi:hypothetical protein